MTAQRVVAGVLLAVLGPSPCARAQASQPPGPYVIDLRGATIGLPSAPTFFSALPTSAFIPGRAFGIEIGGHLLLGRWGPSRIGVGGSWLWARGTATGTERDGSATGTSRPPEIGVSEVVHAIAPQVSLNFGTRDGWSYVSGGVGMASVASVVSRPGVPEGRRTTGVVPAYNVGAGARWFTSPRVAVGFDVRVHGIRPTVDTPATTQLAASVGLSVR